MDEEARAQLRAQHVGFVFQSFMLIPTLNALENVELPALLRGENSGQSKAGRKRCSNNWDWENGLTTFRHSFPAANSSA
ncbi:hypothetical protein SEEN554_10785 [Salmonella enterica subsp. enterica serovar Newport str. CVM 21554]|nr:hypothetical protein SEEN554_10785 [Salmonella enterica subsp. enterica serovar Newport str. CVM 21554]